MPSKEIKKIGPVISRASVDSSSYNETEGTVRVTFATEEKVYVKNWEGDYYQVLVCKKDAIRSQRLDNGAVHLLDTHNDSTIKNVYGAVVGWGIEDKKCWADIKLTTDPDKAGTVGDIKAGVIRTVSIKAKPWGAIVGPSIAGDTVPTILVSDWEPMEISLAPVPGDSGSVIRTADNNDYTIEILKHKTDSEMEAKFVQEIIERCEKSNLDLAFAKDLILRNIKSEDLDKAISDEVERRAKNITPPAPQQEKPKSEENKDNPALQVIERCDAAGLDLGFAKDLIKRNLTIEEANAAIVDEIARTHKENQLKNNPPAPKVTGADEKDIIRTAMQDGLISRADANSGITLNEKSREFRNMSLLDIARTCVIEEEVYRGSTFEKAFKMANGLGKNDLIKRAIATTDYADLLTSTVGRQLRKYYTPAESPWKKLSTQTSVSDFRAKTGVEVDGSVTFEKIAEGGEYKASKILTTGKATIQVDTYGRMISITRKAIINDDLDALSRIPKYFAQGAMNMQADMVFAMITGGHDKTKTPDGKFLFVSDHGNYVSSGSAMSETTINDGIVAMAKQKTPAGEFLNITPKYLLVPLEKVMLAKKLMAGVTAGSTNDVNTLTGALEIITDARLSVASANSWYLFAGTEYEGLMHAYLDGEESLFTESQTNFYTDSIETKARLEFGVASWNHRPWYKNAGA